MSHVWVRKDGLRSRVKMSLFYDNLWQCDVCGARSGPVQFKPSDFSKIDPDGYAGTRYRAMTCDEYAVYAVLHS